MTEKEETDFIFNCHGFFAAQQTMTNVESYKATPYPKRKRGKKQLHHTNDWRSHFSRDSHVKSDCDTTY